VNVLPAAELTRAYEALRAQATGELPRTTPRGLALLLAAGVPAWLTAWQPLTPTVLKGPAPPQDRAPTVGVGREVVQLLMEMALGCHKGWTS
jgi:hypothetical protein